MMNGSWKATQKIIPLLWTSKILSRAHKSPQLDPILSQNNPINSLTITCRHIIHHTRAAVRERRTNQKRGLGDQSNAGRRKRGHRDKSFKKSQTA
jgi:hypothetical protein